MKSQTVRHTRSAGPTLRLLVLGLACAPGLFAQAPRIDRIDPNPIPTLSVVTIHVLGANFTMRSQVLWNGALLQPTFVSPSELQIILTADSPLIAQPGAASIQIYEQRCTADIPGSCDVSPDLYSNLVIVAIQPPTVATCSLYLTVAGPLTGTSNANYSVSFILHGGTPPYSLITTTSAQAALNDAGLQVSYPAGDTMLVSGSPTKAGSYTLPLSGKDQNYCIAQQTVQIVIANGLVLTTQQLADACVGEAYSQPLQAAGGTAPYKWYFTGGAFPTGISLDPAKGVLSGTPAKPANDQPSWTYYPRIQVDDSAPVPSGVEQVFPLTLYPTLTVTTNQLPDATIGVYYWLSFQAAGCKPPYQWKLDSSSLRWNGQSITPAQLHDQVGVDFSAPDAALNAIAPKQGGALDFTVIVSDATGGTAQKALHLNVVEPRLVVATSSLPDGTVGVSYSQRLTVQNGTPPYTWQTTGALPDGLTLSNDPQSPSQAAIKGIATKTGTFTFQVTVTDKDGFKTPGATQLQIHIAGPLASAPAINPVDVSGNLLPNLVSDPEGGVRLQVRIKNGYSDQVLSGTLSVSGFNPASGIPLDAGFASSYQLVRLAETGTGTSVDFEVPAGGELAQFVLRPANGVPAARQNFIELQTGNVAGDVTLGISRLAVGGIDITPQPVASTRLSVPSLAPRIAGLCVAKQPGVGLQVSITGYSTARDLLSAQLTLSGTGLDGVAPLTVNNLDAQLLAWYQTPDATNFGSSFIFKQLIPVIGSLDGITSVSVTLGKKDSTDTVTTTVALSAGCGPQ